MKKTAQQKAKQHKKNENQNQNTNEPLVEFNYVSKDVPFPPKAVSKFTFIDLFAGIGGFRIAMQNIGGRCVYTSEWDHNAQITYFENFGDKPFGDITNPKVKSYIPDQFDILCAGFPCQAFSIAGYRKGFSDTRGTLFFDIEQIVDAHRPKVIFLENVKNLLTHDKGNTFKVIKEIIENKLRYRIFYKVLNTLTHANIPQNRERIFIVAFDPEKVKNFHKFKFPDEIPLTSNIHDYIDHSKQEENFYYSSDHPYYEKLSSTMTNPDTVYQWRRIYVRENKNNACPTLTANMGTGGHNVPLIRDKHGIRKLTPAECFAFQGYPMDKFILPKIANSKLYMQAGNSVTTTLVERISKEILKVM
ncbi:DNA (cytosine-5-)-methyltransferase [Taylorella equigenitalis]|uniref:DNA (cytosine-5-)-methyltransferase n=1 Tax=Taylorella equigenitalis TaxID=29575 RepID=UPI00237CAC95|nr:DNA (cytosine-5-)-methyltransferase [Taylorella equigenitalis]WDU54579.1 DNA (cytosine-5-)-methyltransferase [Taylorella equigenitalis]